MHCSIVVPIYNDGFMAEKFAMEFLRVFKEYYKKENIENDIELIFVNDGSKNESYSILESISKEYKFVKAIELSRNFGQHIALSCGYANASGEFVGMLNVDMQDPPSQIPILLDYLENNNVDIVFGLRETRYSSISDKYTSLLFNFVLNKLTGNNTPSNVSTIRVMNRKFITAYNSLTEKSRYLPGLENWLGFKHGFVKTVYQDRREGKSSYNFKKRLIMAIDSIISFSDLPLKLIAISGIGIAFLGFFLNLILVLSKLFFTEYKPGFTSTISIITFLGGIQILVTGMGALYIGRILKEVQNRPLYLIRNKSNF